MLVTIAVGMSTQHFRVQPMGEKGDERKLAEFVKMPKVTKYSHPLNNTK